MGPMYNFKQSSDHQLNMQDKSHEATAQISHQNP